LKCLKADGKIAETKKRKFFSLIKRKKQMSLIEKAFVGSVTLRVIGYSRQDVLGHASFPVIIVKP